MKTWLFLVTPVAWLLGAWWGALESDVTVRAGAALSTLLLLVIRAPADPILRSQGARRLTFLWLILLTLWTGVGWLVGLPDLAGMTVTWAVLSFAPIAVLARWDRSALYSLLASTPLGAGLLLLVAAVERVLIDGAGWLSESAELGRMYRVNTKQTQLTLVTTFLVEPIVFALQLLQSLLVSATYRRVHIAARVRGPSQALKTPTQARLLYFLVLTLFNICLIIAL